MIPLIFLPAAWWGLYVAGAMVACNQHINRCSGRLYGRSGLLTHHVQTLRLKG